MSSGNKASIKHRLTALANALGASASLMGKLKKAAPKHQQKDKNFTVMTLMENLTNIQRRGERELRALKDLSKRDGEDSADMIQTLESILEVLGEDIKFMEGKIGKK
ncbi:hypothetical protein BGX38DRAFT_1268821 [Terfezia claveryi]|nr:hypothetical protein BGX38DRAFT_1268821 [Terfezia claveryi]